MELALKDKVIVVTGGAKGIGKAICQVLSEENAIPVVVGKNEQDNIKALSDLDTKAFQVVADLTKPDECKKAVQRIVDKFSCIDGLVNNAGVNDGIGLENGSYEDFIASMHRNVVHYFLMAHHALPFLKKSSGPIVNIGSKTAETGQGSTSGYAAANGARNALTREWAVELLRYHIRVNAVIVAESYTPLYENWLKSFPDPEKKLKQITDKIPFENRMTEPREIANMVAFLLSEKSSHMTGQLIHVDGGYVHLDRAINPIT